MSEDESDEKINRWLDDSFERSLEILKSLDGKRQPKVESLALYMAAIIIQIKQAKRITDEQADLIRDELGIESLALAAMGHVIDECQTFIKNHAQLN